MALFDDLKGTTSYTFFLGRFLNKVFLKNNSGVIEIQNVGGPSSPITSTASFKRATYLVLTPYAANEIINVNSGVGNVSGTATLDGDPTGIILPSTALLFKKTANLSIILNGVTSARGDDAIWDSTTSFHFRYGLNAGEVFEIMITG